MSNKNNQLDELKDLIKQKDEKLCLFIENFKLLHETLKMHILFYHYEDYLEKSRDSLLYTSDEVTEAVHLRVRMFEERHGYNMNRKVI